MSAIERRALIEVRSAHLGYREALTEVWARKGGPITEMYLEEARGHRRRLESLVYVLTGSGGRSTFVPRPPAREDA